MVENLTKGFQKSQMPGFARGVGGGNDCAWN